MFELGHFSAACPLSFWCPFYGISSDTTIAVYFFPLRRSVGPASRNDGTLAHGVVRDRDPVTGDRTDPDLPGLPVDRQLSAVALSIGSVDEPVDRLEGHVDPVASSVVGHPAAACTVPGGGASEAVAVHVS